PLIFRIPPLFDRPRWSYGRSLAALWLVMAPGGLGRHPFRAVGQARRRADGGAAGRYVRHDDRPGADLGKVADMEVAEDRRTGGEQHAAADPRRPAHERIASSDGDVLHDRDLVADLDQSSHDDPGSVI